ncbi:MAG: AraC family transcriptional regulator [Ferruginibacter sp.]
MPTQLNIFILLFGALQGLLFSLFLYRKKLHQNGYIFLLLYLGVMLLQLTLKVMNKIWLMDNWSFLYTISYYLPLLYGPFAFLFVTDIVEHRYFNPKSILHLLPFFFTTVIAFLAGFKGIPPALDYFLYNPHIRLTILSLSIITYHTLAFRNWQKHRMSLKDYFADTSRLQITWVRNFVLWSFIVCGLVVAALYLLYINYPSGHEWRYGFAGLTIFMYWISYTALKQPAIFSVIKGRAETGISHIPKLVVHRQVKKYANSSLDEYEKNRISEALNVIIRRDKLYLDAELTIDKLADKVGCSRHSLSQVLNECMQQSFYDYINSYRVVEAKMLLAAESRKNHKIASIAYDAGFNSLSTFNDVFRKITGQTPSQHRKQPQPQASMEERV